MKAIFVLVLIVAAIAVAFQREARGQSLGIEIDAHCVTRVVDWCRVNRALGGEQCFKLASHECAGKSATYGRCVALSAEACKGLTSSTHEQCFSLAKEGCGGR